MYVAVSHNITAIKVDVKSSLLLCQLIVHTALKTSNRKIDLPPETEASWVEQFVRSQIVQH
ncbi:hypothetical protein [Nostoc sp. CHAB 5715]|uniref:hypothetical protein n=1 Tax=Nostoc sp. CHAB 5715 TaxID=2780400 RepID=UPI001E310B8F|nr:hypothetical protein [Nostoc sp. CHAB 5715]MCC5622289.1 hypothetical protein [Nostoc sp. CHAB 5715]